MSAPLPALKGFAFHLLNLKPPNKLKAESSHALRASPSPAQQPGLDQGHKNSTCQLTFWQGTSPASCPNSWGVGNAAGNPLEPLQGEMLIEIRKPTVQNVHRLQPCNTFPVFSVTTVINWAFSNCFGIKPSLLPDCSRSCHKFFLYEERNETLEFLTSAFL